MKIMKIKTSASDYGFQISPQPIFWNHIRAPPEMMEALIWATFKIENNCE